MTLVTPCLRQAAAMPGTSDISNECEPGFSIMRSVVSGRIMASIASGEAAGSKNSTSTPIVRRICSANSRVGP